MFLNSQSERLTIIDIKKYDMVFLLNLLFYSSSRLKKIITMRSINRCLNKQLVAICQRSVELEELSSKLAQLLPENLAVRCKVGSFNKGCLILTTTNAAWASQLRYAIPELRDKLRKEAGLYQLSSIKIAVIEPIIQYDKTEDSKKHHLSEKAKATIISESLQCTYEPLQKALFHLADK